MSDNEKKTKTQPASDSTNEVQAENVKQLFDEADEKGYFGLVTDPTPNENYTLRGVASGAPTPETDEDLAEEARKARRVK